MSPGNPVPDAPDTLQRSVVISSRPGWPAIELAEIWRYRHLPVILAMRDIKVRYKQTFLGIAWVIIQPVVTMLIFATLFRLLLAGGNLPTFGDVPYAISTCTANAVSFDVGPQNA